MGFDSFNKLKQVKEAIAEVGTEKTVQLLGDLNLVLGLLPDAGFDVSEVEVELGLAPRVSISLKLGGAVNEARLKSLQENADNAMLSAVLSSLIQASKLQNALNVDTLALK
ncbi:MAG TPA: hypothetical protein VND65_02925, partial [Candidatus Binatia bacterium]|nr:hypothetical protein [Candidatus Binatia bacterium]